MLRTIFDRLNPVRGTILATSPIPTSSTIPLPVPKIVDAAQKVVANMESPHAAVTRMQLPEITSQQSNRFSRGTVIASIVPPVFALSLTVFEIYKKSLSRRRRQAQKQPTETEQPTDKATKSAPTTESAPKELTVMKTPCRTKSMTFLDSAAQFVRAHRDRDCLHCFSIIGTIGAVQRYAYNNQANQKNDASSSNNGAPNATPITTVARLPSQSEELTRVVSGRSSLRRVTLQQQEAAFATINAQLNQNPNTPIRKAWSRFYSPFCEVARMMHELYDEFHKLSERKKAEALGAHQTQEQESANTQLPQKTDEKQTQAPSPQVAIILPELPNKETVKETVALPQQATENRGPVTQLSEQETVAREALDRQERITRAQRINDQKFEELQAAIKRSDDALDKALSQTKTPDNNKGVASLQVPENTGFTQHQPHKQGTIGNRTEHVAGALLINDKKFEELQAAIERSDAALNKTLETPA